MTQTEKRKSELMSIWNELELDYAELEHEDFEYREFSCQTISALKLVMAAIDNAREILAAEVRNLEDYEDDDDEICETNSGGC